jgi:hypothetical protein
LLIQHSLLSCSPCVSLANYLGPPAISGASVCPLYTLLSGLDTDITCDTSHLISAASICIEAVSNVSSQHNAHLAKQAGVARAAYLCAAVAASSSATMSWAIPGLSVSLGHAAYSASAAIAAAAPPAAPRSVAPAAFRVPLWQEALKNRNRAAAAGKVPHAMVAALAIASGGTSESGGDELGSEFGWGGAAADGWANDGGQFMDLDDQAEK